MVVEDKLERLSQRLGQSDSWKKLANFRVNGDGGKKE